MTWTDVVVVVLLTTVIGALYAATWSPGEPAHEAHVHVNGKRVATLDLYRPQRVNIEGAIGTSVIEVGEGRARFAAAPCRNKVCLSSGWLSDSGDVTACVPNRVSLALTGAEREYDSINF